MNHTIHVHKSNPMRKDKHQWQYHVSSWRDSRGCQLDGTGKAHTTGSICHTALVIQLQQVDLSGASKWLGHQRRAEALVVMVIILADELAGWRPTSASQQIRTNGLLVRMNDVQILMMRQSDPDDVEQHQVDADWQTSMRSGCWYQKPSIPVGPPFVVVRVMAFCVSHPMTTKGWQLE